MHVHCPEGTLVTLGPWFPARQLHQGPTIGEVTIVHNLLPALLSLNLIPIILLFTGRSFFHGQTHFYQAHKVYRHQNNNTLNLI